MRLSASAIEILLAKGFTGEDILALAWEMEGGRPAPKVPAAAANDRPRRLGSEERRRVYADLCDRDGERCCECKCSARTIWRRMGVSSGSDWPWDQEHRNRFMTVYPTSNLEVDHKQPLWAGGDNAIANLWLLCVDCHKAKTATEASQRRRA